MDIALVHEELRGRVRRQVDLPTDRWWGRKLTRALTGLAPSGDTSCVTISMPKKRAPSVRVYRPNEQQSDAALFWIHGGGMIIGRASIDDRLCASTARELGMVVVSAEYRLAPDHSYPIPLDDCLQGWMWLQEHAASLGVDRERIAIGGQSAGGGLAAGLVQRLADSTYPDPVAQWLFCPMLDDRTAADRDLDRIDHFVWNNRINRFGWRSYLGTVPGSPRVPEYAAPARRTDLGGLPPAWIGVGDIDLFRDEDMAYAAALRAGGAPVDTVVVPGAPHGFEAWAPDTVLAREYVAGAQAWLREALAR
ncbi:alpha/beta hydrolase [Curtobacterium sp. Leaf261]|uniref:alpha/beta hydrolase n=1 Tax=Curtobacterium sp. Leaf261 TaxID=1736311 RepID=UPI0006FFCC1C|nr:alpha/beta hydrolase [Curtobacterium sp. Leaf261]KQO64303.1 esterase [Curtobacterium sp. Leaf261]